MKQEDIFVQGEADKWFLRNKDLLIKPERIANDPILKVFSILSLKPTKVLEIGASNGYRLHNIHETLACPVTGVEPSLEAIKDGQSRFPEIEFHHGVASALPISENGLFDLVILNFVFSWIDRNSLIRSIAEVDRMVHSGGSIIIGDFYSSVAEKVAYHHVPNADMWTYKQNYIDIFLSSNLYELGAFLTFNYDNHQLCLDFGHNNRTYVAVLKKSLTRRYQTKLYP